MKMDLNVSGVEVLNSTPLDQSANILSLLMTRQGWHDPGESIHQETLTAQDKQQRLTEAFENYTLHSDVHSGQTLMELLQEAEADLKAEYDYARKQYDFYLQEAEKEATGGSGFFADWMQWIRQGVQDFFGSSNSGLADKYNQIAEDRQSQLKELSKFKTNLQQKLLLENTEKEEDIIEIDFAQVKANQRRLLQSSSGSQTLILEEIPDQTINALQLYNYPIDGAEIFNVNFTALIATSAGQNILPSWLQFYTTELAGFYTPTSADYCMIRISENFAYIADYGTGLKIFNISNPVNPVLIGNGPVSYPFNLAIGTDNNVIYLVNDNGVGLQVFNISNPFAPVLIGNYSLPGSSSGIDIDGDMAYVISGSNSEPISMSIFNVSDPRELGAPIGSWSTTSPSPYGGIPIGIQIQGNFAYIGTVTASEIYNVLYIVDISNPQSPVTFVTYQSPSFFGWFPYLSTFKVDNNFIYVSQGNNLIIMDISNPQNPTILFNAYISAGLIRSYGIFENFIYFAADNEGLKIINISDPNNPTPVIAQYDTFGHAYDFQIKGSFAYIADFEGGLKIVDLRKNILTGTPPNNVSEQFDIRLSACNLSGSLLAYEDFIITIDSNLPQAIGNIPDQSVFPGEMLQIPISNSLLFSNADKHNLNLQLVVTNSVGSFVNPWIYLGITSSLLGEVDLVSGNSPLYIEVQSGYGYIATSNGFQIINVTDSFNPQLLSTYQVSRCSRIQVDAGLAYLAGGSAGLLIFNVNDPLNPVQINTYNPSGNYLRGLFIESKSQSTLAYLIYCCGPNVLQIVNVTNPNSLQSLGQLTSGSENSNFSPVDIQVQNGFAYLGNQNIGNQTLIINVSDPGNPIALSSYVSTDTTQGIAIQGNMLYIAGRTQGLLILNVSNPLFPRLVGNIQIPGSIAAQVFVQGTLAFLADNNRGLEIVDISDPTRPQLISVTNHPALLSTYVLGSLVYNGDSSNWYLQIIDVSQRTIIGNPTTADIGNYQATLTATDELGATASINFKIFVEGPPVINGSIPAQYAKIGQLYNYFVPQGVVSDPNDNLITFSAVQQGQSSLMSWLSFNSISATFAGTPLESDQGNFTILLSATDHISGTVSTLFNMLVSHLPVVKQAIPNQIANIGVLYQYTVSATTFFSQEGFALFLSAQQSNELSLPLWLKFNTTTNQFLGRPNITDAGVYSLQVVASDDYQGQTAEVFSLIVEHFPSMNPAISLKPPLAGVGLIFSWTIPSNAFIDLDNNPFTYSAIQANGAPLPNWLSFNPQSLIFSGTPSSLDVQNLPLQLIATDLNGGQASRNFTLTVTYFPVVMTSIPKQLSNIGNGYNYTIPSGTFSEADQAVLLYSVQQSNGQPLPQWLSFNSIARQLSGWPNATVAGTYLLEASATNPEGAVVATDFSLIVEHFPEANNPLQPPLVEVGKAFNWVIPSNAFIDLDNEVLTYSASKKGGSLLPNWLSFNPTSLLFSGTPLSTDIQTLELQLMATDGNGAQAQQIFNLTVTNFPVVMVAIPKQLLNIGVPYNYTLPNATFSEADQVVLLYSVQQSNGGPLPGWLSFNNMTRQLSGWPNATVAGTYLLEASAANPEGAIATTDFSLIVEHFPEVFYTIPTQLADINQLFSFTLPINSFLDKDGEPLTYYSTTTGNGGPLPNWLVFNPQNQFYSGVPLETDRGTLSLVVVATDPAGAFASSNLTLQVIHFPTVVNPQTPVTVRAGQSFSFAIADDAFEDADGSPLSYSTGALPDWLNFDSSHLNFSGQAGSIDIGTVSLTVIANDTRGASVGMNFKLMVRGNQPPEITTSLSTQTATVQQAFSFFLPNNLFIDPNNNSLTITVDQQGGFSLPEWLAFDNQTLEFSGVPGYGDTNFYAIRTLSIEVTAASVEGQTNTDFSIEVGGTSWGQLAVTIGAPLISLLTTLFGLYQGRALCLNYMNKKQYTKLENISVEIGNSFEYPLETKADKIYQIRVLLPFSEAKSCCGFFKPVHRPIPGGNSIPWWMEYDDHDNILRSRNKVPELNKDKRELIVQVEDEAGIIQEKFTIRITSPEEKNNNLREVKEDNNDQSRLGEQVTDEVEMTNMRESPQPEEKSNLVSSTSGETLLPPSNRQSLPARPSVVSPMLTPPDSPLRAAESRAKNMTKVKTSDKGCRLC